MLNKRLIELAVGLFVLAGVLAMFILALKVSGLNNYSDGNSFIVEAIFDNVGDLKVRAPITIAGVRVGEVSHIAIDNVTFKAKVMLRIERKQNRLPADTTAKILTAGIIGANYVELIPGYAEATLQAGQQIVDTQSAIILENLISQLIYKFSSGDKK